MKMLKFSGSVDDFSAFVEYLLIAYGKKTTLKEVILTLEAMRK
jgi:hypothetical protein